MGMMQPGWRYYCAVETDQGKAIVPYHLAWVDDAEHAPGFWAIVIDAMPAGRIVEGLPRYIRDWAIPGGSVIIALDDQGAQTGWVRCAGADGTPFRNLRLGCRTGLGWADEIEAGRGA